MLIHLLKFICIVQCFHPQMLETNLAPRESDMSPCQTNGTKGNVPQGGDGNKSHHTQKYEFVQSKGLSVDPLAIAIYPSSQAVDFTNTVAAGATRDQKSGRAKSGDKLLCSMRSLEISEEANITAGLLQPTITSLFGQRRNMMCLTFSFLFLHLSVPTFICQNSFRQNMREPFILPGGWSGADLGRFCHLCIIQAC